MANHPQAEKRNRQRIKRQARNRFFRATMRTFIKRVRTAIEAKDGGAAREALEKAIPIIDRCAQKGVIPRQRASRTISRLARAVGEA
ncbi:MAG: 30S ribosomal protein S20 [Deltaproteobacteria bacterium]|nr:30S ribosomal protein S20 [Deltaproteobacteria bacterium]